MSDQDSDQDIDQPGEFVDQFAERFHRKRREHGGEIDRLDPDQLDKLTEEERVEAGVDAYDPDEVPPATDTPPLTDDVPADRGVPGGAGRVPPGVRQGRAVPDRRRAPVPAHPVRQRVRDEQAGGGGPNRVQCAFRATLASAV